MSNLDVPPRAIFALRIDLRVCRALPCPSSNTSARLLVVLCLLGDFGKSLCRIQSTPSWYQSAVSGTAEEKGVVGVVGVLI